MDVGVEVSLYPFEGCYAPLIHTFIGQLEACADLKVLPGSLSTQVYGEYGRVFAALGEAMRTTLAARQADGSRAAFVLKVLGPL